jgi:hypothetical protein
MMILIAKCLGFTEEVIDDVQRVKSVINAHSRESLRHRPGV